MDNRKVVQLASATACLAIIVKKLKQSKKTKKGRKWWVRPALNMRAMKGFYTTLHSSLRKQDANWFQNFVRMREENFDFLVAKLTPYIKKENTTFRKAISVGERLAVTLRYLATGDSFSSLMCLFLLGKTTVAKIVKETCKALFECLKDSYMKMPTSREEWLDIANTFEERWNFPNCCGALDGKHVRIEAPPNSGSEYFCYKQHNSLVWLALVNAEYKFIYVDIGAFGRESDGGVFSRSSLSSALAENTLNFPPPKLLPEGSEPVPFVIVADDAFPLKTYLQKPYSYRDQIITHKIFNYRLSRARNVVENAFGICAARFRILRRPINVKVTLIKDILLAICVLHNYLIDSKSGYVTSQDLNSDINGIQTRGNWCNEISSQEVLTSVQPTTCIGRPTDNALRVRELLTEYFMTPTGELQWQYNRSILN